MTSALALLSQHRRDLEAMLAANARASVNRITRMILNGIDEQARTWLARIDREDASEGFRFSSAGMFGPNGHAPAIADLIRSAEQHRRMGQMERAA